MAWIRGSIVGGGSIARDKGSKIRNPLRRCNAARQDRRGIEEGYEDKKEDRMRMRMRIKRERRREEEKRKTGKEKEESQVTGWGGVNRVWLVHP